MTSLLLLSLLQPAFAEDELLVPEFTPESISDFAAAFLTYESVLDDLRGEGVSYVDGERLRSVSGDMVDACADIPECPMALFGDWSAELAMVGSVRESTAGLDITIRFYEPGNETAIRVLSRLVPESESAAFTAEAAQLARELLGERGGGGVDLSDVDTGYVPAPVEPAEPDEPYAPIDFSAGFDDGLGDLYPEEPEPAPEPIEDDPPGRPGWSAQEEERREMRVRERTYNRYLASGMSQRDWTRQNRIRSGQISVDLSGGLGLGAVDRAYDVRVALLRTSDDEATQESWSQYGATAGSGFQGGLGLGYHFNSWVEAGVFVGAVRGEKSLSVGWEGYLDDEPVEGDAYDYTYEAASAWTMVIEPRARLYILDAGVAKPYGLVGVGLKVSDSFVVPAEDQGLVEYPDVGGGLNVDAVIGAGLALDVNEHFGVTLEVPFGLGVSDDAASSSSDYVTNTPEVAEPSGYLARVSAGVQARF